MNSKQEKSLAKSNDGKYPRKDVQCEEGKTGEERGRKYAELTTSPALAAYRVINSVEQKSGIDTYLDVPTLMETLGAQAKAVNCGDLTQAEAMLMNQATALQSLFARLTEKAFSVTHVPHFDGFMRLALRAQNQCRATLETLSAIKNPPVVIAKQANIAHGAQQVNNSIANAAGHARAGGNTIQQNELLTEVQHGTTVDSRATGAAIGNDSAMATMGEINRSTYNKG
jgi:hypothetical protein